jgi:ATP-dependent Clp protease ATP-binding subunit ClpA
MTPDGQPQRARLAGLGEFLENRLFGQTHALKKFTERVQGAGLNLNERRNPNSPQASFLFLGPTGVGKTETCKLAAKFIFGEGAELETVYMNEYQRLDRLDALISRIGEIAKRNPQGNFLLFDEIEKAHISITDLFLSLLDEGVITLLDESRASLKNFYIVLTSNLGSGELAEMQSSAYATMERFALGVASENLKPELFARITEKIVYRPLASEVQMKIVQSVTRKKLDHLERQLGCRLEIESGPATAQLLKAGINRNQGARGLQNEIDRVLNAAVLPFAIKGGMPQRGLFIYDKQTSTIVLT